MTTDKIENPSIQQFIIETSLVRPVSGIIEKLNNGHFRDCDIKWLDARLESFMKQAAYLLNVSLQTIPRESFTILNDHNTKYYLKHFNVLLSYFKKFDQSL